MIATGKLLANTIFLVFLEGLSWFRGSSMGVCEALCDMLACKKGLQNVFDLKHYFARGHY